MLFFFEPIEIDGQYPCLYPNKDTQSGRSGRIETVPFLTGLTPYPLLLLFYHNRSSFWPGFTNKKPPDFSDGFQLENLGLDF